VPGGMAAGALDDHPRRHLVLVLERPQLAVVLFQEPLARPPKRVWEPWRHGDAGEVGRLPELGLGGRQVDPQVRTQPFPHPVDEQPATVVHVQVGKHHVGHGCEIDASGLQSLDQPPHPRQVRELLPHSSGYEFGPVAATHQDHV